MDPALQPQVAACGTLDGAAAASAACGAAMAPVCSGGYNDGGVLRSLLLDTASNCSRWAAAVQTTAAVLGTAAGGSSYLDAAMHAYCGGVGSLTAECACLAFPLRAADWCAGASLSCPAFPDAACAAQEFAQLTPDGTALDVVQFTSCNPYYCWLAACYESPSAMLLDSAVLATQSAAGACAGVCGQFVSAATTSIGPMPPGSFSPQSVTANVSIMTACGSKTKPALITAVPQTWVWPVNAVTEAPLYVTNNGDYAAQVSVTSASLAACELTPGDNVLFGRSVQQFAVKCDQAALAAAFAASASYDPRGGSTTPSLTVTPTFELTYLDLASGETRTTPPLGITAVLHPAAAPITVSRSVVPPWFWVAAAALLVLVAVQFFFVRRSRRAIAATLAANGVGNT